MLKPRDPRELAIDLMSRSTCSVQVGCCIADDYGIFSWGSNHIGFDGLGCHAEIEAIRKANHKRMKKGAFLYVSSRRKRNGKVVNSKPCDACHAVIKSYSMHVWFRLGENLDGTGLWLRAL